MRPLQKQIIDELKVLPEIDPEKEIRRNIRFSNPSCLASPEARIRRFAERFAKKQSASFVKKRETLITSLLPFACRMAIKPMNRMQWMQSSS